MLIVPDIPIAAPTETGATGILHLKRLWSKLRTGQDQAYPDERQQDYTLLNLLGVGLLPLYQFVHGQQPDFAAFEAWIVAHHGAMVPEALVRQCNALMTGQPLAVGPPHPDVLTAADLAHWEQHGYVIVRNAVGAADCAATRQLIWDFLGMREDEPASWYREQSALQGIMVPLYQHPLIQRNQQNPVIRRAFEQVWGTRNLIVSADKVGFNPPETPQHHYRGTGIHWDVSLVQPVPFGTQGILYLTDVAAHGGALRLVPGFHHRLPEWLASLPLGAHPRRQSLEPFGIEPIAANAGDFIIWHHALPHDGSPNTAATPRLVQYFKWFDPTVPEQRDWL